jgi:hypothetical protein
LKARLQTAAILTFNGFRGGGEPGFLQNIDG